MEKKIYIGLIGKMGSGKETVFKITKEELGREGFSVSILHFSDIINEILTEKLLKPVTRDNQQRLSWALRQPEAFGEEVLGEVMYARALGDSGDVIIIDGIRRPNDVVKFRTLNNFHLVFISVSQEIRFDRIKERHDRMGDKEKTWEQFIKEDGAEPERMIDVISKDADEVIDNSGTLEELKKRVSVLIQKLNLKKVSLI